MVSVILSSYNHAAYIAESIKSVLAQTYIDFELLIFDDGSKDESQAVIRSFSDERIRLFLYEANRGGIEVLRDVLPQVRGRYIAIHHSDDLWAADKLEQQVRFMEEHDDYAACFTGVNFIDEQSHVYELADGNEYGTIFEQPNRTRFEWLRYFFYSGNCLCHPSVMLRRNVYEECRLLDMAGIRQLPDLLMWIRLCMQREIYILPEKLTYFRIRRQQQDNMSGDRPDMRVREAFEQSLLLDEYRPLCVQERLLQVFPEAEEYLRDGWLDPDFVFAKLCLGADKQSYKAVGLDILYALLQQPERAACLAERYHYTERDFFVDTGAQDAFGVRSAMQSMQVSLYYDDGDGYNEQNKQTNLVYVTSLGNFSTEFILEIPETRNVCSLILNLHEGHLLKISLRRFLFNGEACTLQPIDRDRVEDGADVFCNLHPRYEVFHDGQGRIRVFVQGWMDLHSELLLKDFREHFDALAAEKARQQLKVDGLTAENEALRQQLYIIFNTRGERFLRKIRAIREFFK